MLVLNSVDEFVEKKRFRERFDMHNEIPKPRPSWKAPRFVPAETSFVA